MLCLQGLSTVQVIGIQPHEFVAALGARYQAIVIALKSRSVAPEQARYLSRTALDQLRELRARQIYFKYCSTFDSTRQGNIGPVIDTLMDGLGVGLTVAVPALPLNGRTQYLGHLFVENQLLSETPMRTHPIHPMDDSNLVGHLQRQTSRKVGLIAYPAVRGGARQIACELSELAARGVAIALIDAVCDDDLGEIAESVVDLRLITGASGLAMKLPAVWARRAELSTARAPEWILPAGARRTLILSGSCSDKTLRQIGLFAAAGFPVLYLDVPSLVSQRENELERLGVDIQRGLDARGVCLVHSSATSIERRQILSRLQSKGHCPGEVRQLLESSTAELACRAVRNWSVSNLIVAGGETAGAVVEGLGIQALDIGPPIDPGVPLCRSLGNATVHLVLKSGNFGSPDFLLKALRRFHHA